MQLLLEQMHSRLERNGYCARTVSTTRIRELQEEIARIHGQGLFNEEFYRDELAFFEFKIPASLPEAKTLIIVAMPQPLLKVTFNFHGKPRQVTLPPTYKYSEDKKVLNILSEILCAHGYNVVQPELPSGSLSGGKLPLKSLAVHSGLGRYGKNNICYVPGMGSFSRLTLFYTDCEFPENDWHSLQLMQRCTNCQICLRSCPTGAIGGDRFLAHAERCITFHNEQPHTEFPAWMKKSWHNSIIGCMRCQKVCPENARFMHQIVDAELFSEEETMQILKATPEDRLPPEVFKKLERLDLTRKINVLPRNLKVLLT
jgi:epoxyqueuosine reductase